MPPVWRIYLVCKQIRPSRDRDTQQLRNPIDCNSTVNSSDIDYLTQANAVCYDGLCVFAHDILHVREAVRDSSVLDEKIEPWSK